MHRVACVQQACTVCTAVPHAQRRAAGPQLSTQSEVNVSVSFSDANGAAVPVQGLSVTQVQVASLPSGAPLLLQVRVCTLPCGVAL